MTTEGKMKSSAKDTSKKIDQEDIYSLFTTKYESVKNISVAKDNTYCLHLASDESWENIAVAMSNGNIDVFKRETMTKSVSYQPHDVSKKITGLKFSPNSENEIWSSSNDGTLKLWDVRSNKFEKEFQDISKTTKGPKPISTFDIANNGRLMCAGTELIGEDAFLLFWDLRGEKLLGGYWESHTDDITQVKFSTVQNDTMATAATDGLINIFDISQARESDALTCTMNPAISIDQIVWINQNDKSKNLAAITDIQSLQYWDVEEAATVHGFTRDEVSKAIRHKEPDNCHLAAVVQHKYGDPLVLVTSGLDTDKDGFLRTLLLDRKTGKLTPHGYLDRDKGQPLVRAALYHPERDSFVTAGEGGVVQVWMKGFTDSVASEVGSLHMKQKNTKHSRNKPY